MPCLTTWAHSCPAVVLCGQCHHQKVFKNNHMAAPVKVARQQTTLSGTLRNLPEVASGTCLRSLHQHTPEPSGTLRNPPEPTPAHTGTLRNLPEPSSGTCSCDPHQHTPELISEDPISLRCWGKKIRQKSLNLLGILIGHFFERNKLWRYPQQQ